MDIIIVIQYALAFLMAALLSYQLICSIWILKGRKSIFSHSNQDRKFAIVIYSTRNNNVVAQSLYSLLGLVYPKKLYDVIILSDCFSADVANTAREMGAVVFNENATLKDKDCRLHWVFEQILADRKEYDAILVIESDSLLSGNYLDVINHYFDQGSSVIQSSCLSLPESGSSGYEKERFNFLINNLLKPVGQKVLDFSINLKGNNFGFTTQMLKKNLDMLPTFRRGKEYGLMLELNGIHVDFAPEAVVWKQMPVRKRGDDKKGNQNTREERSLLKHYIPKLFKAAFLYKSPSYFKKIFDLVTPSVFLMLFIALFMLTINVIAWGLGEIPLIFVWLWIGISILNMANIFIGGYAINKYFQAYQSLV